MDHSALDTAISAASPLITLLTCLLGAHVRSKLTEAKVRTLEERATVAEGKIEKIQGTLGPLEKQVETNKENIDELQVDVKTMTKQMLEKLSGVESGIAYIKGRLGRREGE